MKTVFSESAISAAMVSLAQNVKQGLGPHFTMVPILTGGFIFAADLIRELYKVGCDPEVDFIQLSSYGTGRESSGDVKMLKDVTIPVEGQSVLLVDDVLDSGRSLWHARALLLGQGAKSVSICVAVDKQTTRTNDVQADYVLLKTDGDAFLVGYGMDDAGLRRGLPFIGEVE